MTTFTRAIEINVSKEKVWNALASVGDICHAHPAVLTSHLTSKQNSGVGTTRHCNFAMMGATSEERVIEWNEGNSMKIEAYELKRLPGIKTMVVDFSVAEDGEKSVLTSTMEYTMENRIFDLMDLLVMRRMNSRLLDGIVAGHKKYLEDGDIVTKKTVLELDKVVTIK
jgi:hypothetical protein